MTQPAPITGRTRVMFIMGDPIGHVVGTAVLNAAWNAAGRDLITVPLHVSARSTRSLQPPI